MSERGDIKREFRSKIIGSSRRRPPELPPPAAASALASRAVEIAEHVSAGGHVLVVTGGSPTIIVGRRYGFPLECVEGRLQGPQTPVPASPHC